MSILIHGSVFNREISDATIDHIKNAASKNDAAYMGVWEKIKDFFCGSSQSEALHHLYDLMHGNNDEKSKAFYALKDLTAEPFKNRFSDDGFFMANGESYKKLTVDFGGGKIAADIKCHNDKINPSRNVDFLSETINAKINNFVEKMMHENTQFLGNDYYETHGVNEKALLLACRKGLCGECSDATLDFLGRIDVKGYEKINPSTQHYFLYNKEEDKIIEPTYKQMFFDSQFSKEETTRLASHLKNYPDVFVGDKSEFKIVIDDMCNSLGLDREIMHLNWGL